MLGLRNAALQMAALECSFLLHLNTQSPQTNTLSLALTADCKEKQKARFYYS